MILIYISIIIFVVQFYVLTHTYTVHTTEYFKHKVDFNKAKKLGVPIWVIIVIALFSCIPVLNIIEFVIFWVVWIKYYCKSDNMYNSWYTYWIFKDKFFSKEI